MSRSDTGLGDTRHVAADDLSLLPLQAVLFPGGLMTLRVQEARYRELVGRCLRDRVAFGVVAVRATAAGSAPETALPDDAGRFEDHGVYATVLQHESGADGVESVRCVGGQRFVLGPRHRLDDGLWVGRTEALPDDAPTPPEAGQLGTVRGLANAIAGLRQRGTRPFLEPYRFDDAGWVANRWCEILPIPLAAKQRLMALEDPRQRLRLVDEFLRGKGVVS